jgi:hypothetical protein
VRLSLFGDCLEYDINSYEAQKNTKSGHMRLVFSLYPFNICLIELVKYLSISITQDGMAAQLLKTAKTAAAPVISIVWTCGWFYCVRSDEPVISYMKKKFGGRNPGIWALV